VDLLNSLGTAVQHVKHTVPLLLVIRLHVAAVDQYVLAGDIARVFGTEVTAQAGNFLGAAKA